jgi:hypothetical protein
MLRLPRDVLTTMGTICQANFMYVLHKSYYVQASFDTKLFYKAVSFLLDPVTKEKICLTSERDPEELRSLYHPS